MMLMFFLVVAISSWSLGICRSPIGPSLEYDDRKVCPNALDVVLVIDDSGSISHEEFNSIRQLLLDYTKQFGSATSTETTGIRMGAVLFNDRSSRLWSLSANYNRQMYEKEIGGIKHRGGGTSTWAGLQNARSVFEDPIGGDRKDIPNIIVLLTDGGSIEQGQHNQDRTIATANLLKKDGYRIVVVAIGKAYTDPEFKKEVYAVASSKSDVFEVNFKNLASHSVNLAFTVCPEPKDEGKVCTFQPRDVVFVVDQSLSIDTGEFNKMKKFMSDVVTQLPVRKDQVRIGMVKFAGDSGNRNVPTWPQDHIKVEFDLDDSFIQAEILKKIQNVKQNYGSDDETLTHMALQLTRRELLKPIRGARIGEHVRGNKVLQVVIVFTDGESTYPSYTLKEAKLLQDTGARVIGIGISSDGARISKKEIDGIASEPKNRNAFYDVTFDNLGEIKDNLIQEVCVMNK